MMLEAPTPDAARRLGKNLRKRGFSSRWQRWSKVIEVWGGRPEVILAVAQRYAAKEVKP
jgi:hypothetical protein